MALGARGTTTLANLTTGYRKLSAKAYQAINTASEELGLINAIPKADITALSPREMLFPTDVQFQPLSLAAMIPDGGTEADTFTPALVDAQVSLNHMNARFTFTRLAKFYGSEGQAAFVEKQMKFQGLKMFEGMANKLGLQFYGYSTGVVAEVGGAGAASATIVVTLRDAFGDDNLDQGLYLNQLFAPNDLVAIQRGTTLVPNGFGTVTAVTFAASNATQPVLSITFQGTATLSAGDNLIYAGNAIDPVAGLTLAANSDADKWPVGLKDAVESASVHGLASSTLAAWSAAVNNSTAGRFTPTKLKNLEQQIQDLGGFDGKLQIICARGVERDLEEQQAGLAIFSQYGALPVDVGIKSKHKWFGSRKTPPGHVFAIGGDAYQKLMLTEMPSEDGMGEIDKVQDKAAYVAGKDVVFAFVVRSRRGIGAYRNQTEAVV
jgi:hypothetical protein